MSLQVIEPPATQEVAQAPDDLRREAQRRAALEALSKGASYQTAADAAGVTRRTIYNWKTSDENFAALVEDAIQAGVDLLEDEAHRRAMGWTEDVFNKDGELVGAKFQASDRLMEFMLSGRRPEKFRAPKGGDVTINNTNNTQNVLMSPEVSALLEGVALNKGGGFLRGTGDDK